MNLLLTKTKDGYELVNHEGKKYSLTESGKNSRGITTYKTVFHGIVGSSHKMTGVKMHRIPNHIKTIVFQLNQKS